MMLIFNFLISIIYMINIISQRITRAPLFRHSLATTPLNTNNLFHLFSKKGDYKKSKPQHSKLQQRDPLAHINAPQDLKRNLLQIKKMQIPSEAILQEESLKTIIIEQREVLKKSLEEEIALKDEIQAKESNRNKLLIKVYTKQQLNKYYVKRPLKYLEKIYFTMLTTNIISLGYLQSFDLYNSIGWFYGAFISPAAFSAITLLIGYNFGFWIVRQALQLHLSVNQLQTSDISMIKTNWRNIAELTLIGSQFSIIAYSLLFGSPISIQKLYLILISINLSQMAWSLYGILRSVGMAPHPYLMDYARIVSYSTLLIFFFVFYFFQVAAQQKLQEKVLKSINQQKLAQMREGYQEYLHFFKKKKYKMSENQKINSFDEQ